jgi:sugar phosphate isomerase/epimerase
MKHSILSILAGLIICCSTAFAQKGDVYEVGLSMYSLRQLFEARGGDLDALDYPQFAKNTFGITEIDVWNGGFPEDKREDPAYYRELKKRADKAGSNFFLLMAGAVDSEHKDLKAQAADFNKQTDFAKILGAKYVRVFLKAPKKVERKESLKKAAAALRPIANYAKSKGLVIVIEPMPKQYSGDGVYLADLAKRMNHPALRLMPDFGKMRFDDPYAGTVAMMPYTDVVSAKSHEFDPDGGSREFDYQRLMKSIVDAGFTGIVAIEYEGKELGPVEGVKATQKLLKKLNKK